jgi:hypothetical protein
MKVKLAFWCAVVLAFIGAHAPEGALFYFFATHLLAVSAGLFMLRREHAPRAGVKRAGCRTEVFASALQNQDRLRRPRAQERQLI